MAIFTKIKDQFNIFKKALLSKQLHFENIFGGKISLQNLSSSGQLNEILMACGVLALSSLIFNVPLVLTTTAQFGLILLLAKKKIEDYLTDSEKYSQNIVLQQKVNSVKDQPTFLASFNSLNSTSDIELVNDEYASTVVENNFRQIFEKKDWNEVNILDLPLNALFAIQKEKLEKDELSRKEASNWKTLLEKDYNFFFCKNRLYSGAIASSTHNRKVPYCVLSKKGNDVKVYLHKSVLFNSQHEKQKLFAFFKNEFPLIGETLEAKLDAHAEYKQCQEWVKNNSETVPASENQLVNALITAQDVTSKLLICSHESIQAYLSKIDVTHLSNADIDAINLVIKSMNSSDGDNESTEYMHEQFIAVLKNIIKHQSNIRADDLLKKDVYYLTERFRNMNRRHKPNYLKNWKSTGF